MLNAFPVLRLIAGFAIFLFFTNAYSQQEIEGKFSPTLRNDFSDTFQKSQSLINQNNTSSSTSDNSISIGYVHVYGGMGFSILSSSKIEKLLGDDFGIGIGLPTWSYGFITGYQNIIQFEYNFGISDHNFNNNSIIKSIPNKVIKMDYDTEDFQLKINPFFWQESKTPSGAISAFFLVWGKGDVVWKDENNDGFTGTSQILGVEYALISKNISISGSFKRYGIEFDKTILLGIPFDEKAKASDYILEMKIGFGFGI
ncbi:MAG: hypothetical protein D8M58_13700 [Calditrichaeota bacterium]|nr:MAG: hypothetical protein DWQ03_14940 [Calditrichota bacterium]MBL1206454.1 hypothetical protein [Calditrichota bacterium]NOG46281.1 hypothetical protein [Calditrichota bacterium]